MIVLSKCANAMACSITLQAYDTSGKKIDTRIIFLALHDAPETNLLTERGLADQFRTSGSRIELNSLASGSLIDIRATNPKYRTFEAVTFELIKCGQIVSIVFGDRDSNIDRSFTRSLGKLIGCDCKRDLWLRSIPMFGGSGSGGSSSKNWAEAVISDPACSFEIDTFGAGSRHIFIVGSGSRSILTFDRNLERSGNNDLGNIDISKMCSASGELKQNK